MSEPAFTDVDQQERTIDRRQLRTMIGTAAYHARRVARTMRLGDAEQQDVEQDILLALLERRRFFDPTRGAWSSFADRVARQVAKDVADEIGLDRRRRAGSLDGLPDEIDPIALRAAVDAQLTATPDLDLPLSVTQFVGSLSPDLAYVARLVLHEEGEVTEACRRSGLANSEFFRRLREVRVQLVLSRIVRKRLSSDDCGPAASAAGNGG